MSANALLHCEIGAGSLHQSLRPERLIIQNLSSSLFLIPESWSASGCQLALSRWKSALTSLALKKTLAPAALAEIQALSQARTRKAFASKLDALLESAFVQNHCHAPLQTKVSHIELLISLWAEGCLIWPSGASVAGWSHPSTASVAWGPAQPLAQRAFQHWEEILSKRAQQYRKTFFCFLLSQSCCDSSLDLTPRPDAQPMEGKLKEYRQAMARMIITWQRIDAPAARHYVPSDFTRYGKPKPGCRSDPEFAWATLGDASWEDWRALAAKHLANHARGRQHVFQSLNFFLDYAKREGIPRSPAAFFQPNYSAPDIKLTSNRRGDVIRNPRVESFLQFALSQSCGTRTPRGFLVDPYARIPIEIPEARVSNLKESTREPMPERLATLCAQILTENDYAWPKSRYEKDKRSDWFRWRDPATGLESMMWSPVVVCAILAKLMLPCRSMQIRMLDSGEADSERYDPNAGVWSPNSGPLAPLSAKRVERGVFRAHARDDGSRGSFIFINTNKTADIGAPQNEQGYLMPWEHREALRLFGMLRDWQERFNPIAAPVAWTDIKELKLMDKKALASRERSCFLFRDPTALNKTLPITPSRMHLFWCELLAEAERRLAASGERLSDGAPIKLVLDWHRGCPSRVAYDLHSLRVTAITALYKNGATLDALVKIVGHATPIMTLYYVKESAEKISRDLNAANAMRQEPDAAMAQWEQFRHEQENRQLRPLSVGPAERASGRTRVIMLENGLCLAGGTRCVEGGGQQPAGRDCVRCAHFATGPAFLAGLNEECDSRLERTLDASRGYQLAQDAKDALVSLRAKASNEGSPFSDQAKLDAAESKFSLALARVDDMTDRLRAATWLARQCAQLAQASSEDRLALLLSSSGQQHLTSKTDDRFLSALAQQARFYEAVDARPSGAERCRMRLINSTLSKHGVGRFGFLDDPATRANAASQAAQWTLLRASLGAGSRLCPEALRALHVQEPAPPKPLLLATNAEQDFIE